MVYMVEYNAGGHEGVTRLLTQTLHRKRPQPAPIVIAVPWLAPQRWLGSDAIVHLGERNQVVGIVPNVLLREDIRVLLYGFGVA